MESQLVPRILGGMVVVAGACYAVRTLVLTLLPDLSSRIVSTMVAERSLVLRAAGGANADRTAPTGGSLAIRLPGAPPAGA